jgi:HAD superfamily hydrolase (TIGR01549 family)
MNTLKTVLFDLDDTLFDHRHSSRTALALFKKRFAKQLEHVSLEELERANLEILNQVHVHVLAGSLDIDAARIKRFETLFGRYTLKLSPQELQECSVAYREAYQSARRPAFGAIETLQSLRAQNIKIGIVSNNLIEEQIDKLQCCGLTSLIDSMTVSEEAGFAKPDARIFQIALKRLQSLPHETIMIGDSWENDILGARAIGMAAIWYNCYGESIPDRSIPSIESFSELMPVLEVIGRA